MIATTWRLKTENKNKYVYRLQVESFKGKRSKNKLLKLIKEWEIVGEGFDSKTKDSILFFSREFDTMAEWRQWLKEFPLETFEIKSNGKVKKIKKRTTI